MRTEQPEVLWKIGREAKGREGRRTELLHNRTGLLNSHLAGAPPHIGLVLVPILLRAGHLSKKLVSRSTVLTGRWSWAWVLADYLGFGLSNLGQSLATSYRPVF